MAGSAVRRGGTLSPTDDLQAHAAGDHRTCAVGQVIAKQREGSSYCAGSCTVECGCAMSNQKFTIEIEQEQDQRWIAEVVELPGVITYGNSPDDARARVQALALRVLADRLEHGESVPEFLHISFEAA